ncbi:MAG: hypothetical protein SOY47_04810, partial [Lachnospiraceae bacterium]|nr:hypothetical protein [Lachnospiraceae bacterium]
MEIREAKIKRLKKWAKSGCVLVLIMVTVSRFIYNYWIPVKYAVLVSNRRLSRAISADYFRRKHLSQSAVNEAKAHYIGCHRRLSRAYFSSA